MRRALAPALGVLLVLGLAGSAGARTFSMTGQWFTNRGPLIDIPINGGVFPCATATAGPSCVANLRPAAGGIPGGGLANVTGSAPAQFTVPQNVFAQTLGKQVAAIPFVPTVVQLSTQFTFLAPPVNPAISGPNPAVFRGNAWTGQPGRAAANFGWCPGAPVNPACTNPNPAVHGGLFNGIVRYTAQPNAFGGTMALILFGTAVISVQQIQTTGPPLLIHQLVGNITTAATARYLMEGRGYAAFDTDFLVGGPIHLGFMTGPPCTGTVGGLPVALPPGCGQITTSGPVIGALSNDNVSNWGFPWTTGTVLARNTGTNNGQPASSTLTAMGTDSRTAFGAGNISLVSGGFSHRVLSNQNTSALGVVQLSFAATAAPSASPSGFAAGALLMLLAVGFAARRRL